MYVYVRACTLSPLLFERVFRQQTPSMTEWSPSCGECGFLQCLGISVKEGECSYGMVVQQINQCFEIKSIARQQICIMVSDCFIHENKKKQKTKCSLYFLMLLLPLPVCLFGNSMVLTDTDTYSSSHKMPIILIYLFTKYIEGGSFLALNCSQSP